MRGEAGALLAANVVCVTVHFEIVEARFAYANDFIVARGAGDPIERNCATCTLRMNSRACPDIPMQRCDAHDRVVSPFVHTDAQKRFNPQRTRRRQPGVGVIEVIQMAVRVDQHAYMVCVWRSDCSAPARYVSIFVRATSS